METKRHGYVDGLEINDIHAGIHPNNCAVRERTADGEYVGICCFYLKDGTTCPRHGMVKTVAHGKGATVDLSREDRPPSYGWLLGGSQAKIVVCDKCRLRGLPEDCCKDGCWTSLLELGPCPRCGGKLREAVGRWQRLSPKWKFWKNVGKWMVKEDR